jgi:hypothetical protein
MTTEEVTVLPLDPLVLVVDDELTPRSIITRMVRSLGYGLDRDTPLSHTRIGQLGLDHFISRRGGAQPGLTEWGRVCQNYARTGDETRSLEHKGRTAKSW